MSAEQEKNSTLVIGAGSWGTALALVLAKNGQSVYLWDNDSQHVQNLINESTNQRYLPGIKLPENIFPVDKFPTHEGAIRNIIIVVPCEYLEDVLHRLIQEGPADMKLCLASKGLAPESLNLNHEIVSEILGPVPVAVLSGPSFAKEVADGLPTAVTIASTETAVSEYFSDLFHSETFRIYTHDDIIGVQVGGAVKNVMAIAAGISDGLGFGANTRAAVITRGLAEITRLGVAMGGKVETFMGLAGLGDLVLTCTDDQSRNRRLGLALAKGQDLQQAKYEIGQAIEGARTVYAVKKLADKYQIEMPICEQIYHLINGNCDPRQAVQNLLLRDPKKEAY